MLGEQLGSQCIAFFEHHVQHSTGIVAAGAAAALRVYGAQFRRVFFALQSHRAVGHQSHAKTSRARGKHAVKPDQVVE